MRIVIRCIGILPPSDLQFPVVMKAAADRPKREHSSPAIKVNGRRTDELIKQFTAAGVGLVDVHLQLERTGATGPDGQPKTHPTATFVFDRQPLVASEITPRLPIGPAQLRVIRPWMQELLKNTWKYGRVCPSQDKIIINLNRPRGLSPNDAPLSLDLSGRTVSAGK